MANKTLIRLAQLTGSLDASGGAVHPSAITDKSLQGVLDALAASVKRIHGGSSYSGQAAATFSQALLPAADDTYDLGSAGAAWQDLHLEGDVLMQDAGTVSTAAGILTVSGAGGLALDSVGTDAVNIATEAAAKTITIGNDASTKVDVNALAIELDSAATIVANSVGATTITAGAASTWSTSSGALTITSAAAASWTTAAGDLTLMAANGANDVRIKGDLIPSVDDTYDLGTTGLAWQDLHLEGDVLMQDAGTVSTAAGALTVTSAAAATWSTSAGALTLNGTGGLVLQEGGAAILGIDDARAVTLQNAASIDIDASGAVAIDSSAGSMTMGAILADGQTLTLGRPGAVEMSLAPHGTASNEKFTLANTAGSATNAVKVEAMAGGIDIDAKLVLALDGEAGVNLGIATSGAAVSIGHATSETTVNDNLTVTGDLTVNGATVTIDTTNLSVQDPVITLNEGGQALNANGGLLFTSGSSLAAKPGVAFGRVANDTWGLGQIAVPSSGTMTTVAGMTTSGMTLRAGKFQLAGAADYMELNTDIKIVAAADIILDPGGNNVLPGSDAADDLGSAGVQWKDLYVHGIGYIDQLGTDADPVTVFVNSGEVDGAIIGGESAAAATFTTCDATTDFTIDGMVLTADTITNDAALSIVVSAGNLTANVAGDIALSADGGNVTMDDGSITIFDFDVDTPAMKIMDDAQVANYYSVAVGDHGATTISTVDADAAIAHLTLAPDGDINLNPVAGGKVLIDATVAIDAGVVTGATSITSTNFDGIIGASNARAGTFAAVIGTTGVYSGILKTDDNTAATTTTDGSLQTDGGLSVVLDAVIGDDLMLLSDSAVVHFGAGKDVTLTHTNDVGLHLNAGMRLGFRDQGGEYIYSVADGTLGVVAATEIDLTATDIDINGIVNMSGQVDIVGNLDATGGVDIDADNIKLTVGAGADLEMVHNGSASSIKNKTGMFKIESNGGNLVLSSSAANSEIQFGDAYNGNILTNGLFQLSDSAAEWNTYVSNFAANKSLVGALNSLASGGTRSKFQYAVTGSHAANIPLWINASLDHDSGANGPAALDVYVNGQLLTSGSAIANGDYKIGISDADRVQFFFALESGDQVTINKP